MHILKCSYIEMFIFLNVLSSKCLYIEMFIYWMVNIMVLLLKRLNIEMFYKWWWAIISILWLQLFNLLFYLLNYKFTGNKNSFLIHSFPVLVCPRCLKAYKYQSKLKSKVVVIILIKSATTVNKTKFHILKCSYIEMFVYWNIHIFKYSYIEIFIYWKVRILKYS